MLNYTRPRFLPLLFMLLAASADGQVAAPRATTVETVQFESKLIGEKLPYSVALPADYKQHASQQTRYPVLYLLHGLTGHYTDWLSRTKLVEYAAQHRVIVVTPEGNDSWYTDSASVPNEKYETYIVRELIPEVQKRFRTIESREGRTIAGLSMGGYGALKFGMKYPEMFVFAASMSGALEATLLDPEDSQTSAWVKPSIARAYGKIDNPVRAANDVFKIIRELPAERVAALPYVYFDCGTEDFLIEANRRLAALLLQRKIPHEYRQLPGKHDWPYWDRQVREVLRIAAQKMTPAQAAASAHAAK